MSDDTIRLPSPFKDVAQRLDPLKQGVIRDAYMDEKTYQMHNGIKGLRKYLGIDESSSVCDAFLRISQGQKTALIEDKNMQGDRALRAAYEQLQTTVGLLSKIGQKVDYAIITNIKIDTRIYSCEYIKGGFPPMKQIKRRDSSRNKVLSLDYNGSHIPLYVYKT